MERAKVSVALALFTFIETMVRLRLGRWDAATCHVIFCFMFTVKVNTKAFLESSCKEIWRLCGETPII